MRGIVFRAMAAALGSSLPILPMPRPTVHRVVGGTKLARQFASRRYRSGGFRPHQGAREIARRRRQIERLQLSPVHYA